MILLLTRIWPTAERPSLGSFVRDRARGIRGLRVVRPRSDRMPWPLLYPALAIQALRAGPDVRGVEAHVVVPTGLIGWLVARLGACHSSSTRTAVTSGTGARCPGGALGDSLRRAPRRPGRDELGGHRAPHPRDGRRTGRGAAGGRPGPLRADPRPVDRRVLYLGGKNPRKGYEIANGLADTLVGPWLRDVRPDEIPALIAAHDVVLVPSRAEPFGLVAVEAIASGRWVVASDVGGLADIVIDGVNGTLVADGNFAAALAAVPEYDPAMVAATVEQFSLARWQERMAEVWASLIGPYTPLHPPTETVREPA